jgi:hypothetical protein
MGSFSYLLFLSSVLAADNNMPVHMAQEQLTIQARIIAPSLPPQEITLIG